MTLIRPFTNLQPDPLQRLSAREGDLLRDGGGHAAVVVQRLLARGRHAHARPIPDDETTTNSMQIVQGGKKYSGTQIMLTSK